MIDNSDFNFEDNCIADYDNCEDADNDFSDNIILMVMMMIDGD